VLLLNMRQRLLPQVHLARRHGAAFQNCQKMSIRSVEGDVRAGFSAGVRPGSAAGFSPLPRAC
jgi:hypothetical protein